MQFLAAGEALKRVEKLQPGLLATSFPDIEQAGPDGGTERLTGEQDCPL